MRIKEKDRAVQKKVYVISVLSLAVLYAVFCFVIMPVYFALDGDYAFAGTVLPNIIAYVGQFTELCAVSVAYAVTVYCIYRFDAKNSVGSAVIFAIATLLKYTANMAVTWISEGGIPLEWYWDLTDVVYYTVLEMIPLVVIFVFSKKLIEGYVFKRQAIAKAKNGICEVKEVYPFEKIYSRDNCLMNAALVCALANAGAKMVLNIFNDVVLMIIGGLPQSIDTVLMMLLNYASCLVFGALCYIIVVFALTRFIEKLGKREF